MANQHSETASTRKDHWSKQSYAASASFVPKLATQILTWLEPQPTDRILDIGCGDGKFTENFIGKCHEVYGVDASPQFIKDATADYGSEGSTTSTGEEGGKVSFKVVDCTELETDSYSVDGQWDKVISNAALHWILRKPATRTHTLSTIYRALKPGGKFVFELGGAGCVAEIPSALMAVLCSRGFSLSEAREMFPWFFPSDTWMRRQLESVGFKVEICELVYRSTKLEERKAVLDAEGRETGRVTGGVEGWVRLMLATVLDVVEQRLGEQVKEQVVHEVCQAVQFSTDRTYEDQSEGEYLGYVRLRGVAVKA